MNHKFKLTIIKIKYPFKGDWDGDESLDNISKESQKETVFYYNDYNKLIEKLFEKEVKKRIKNTRRFNSNIYRYKSK